MSTRDSRSARAIRFIGWLCGGAIALAAGVVLAADKPWSTIGRPATTSEIRAWDIDVRPDFKGLPPGSGSVDQGEQVWEAKCASCHGTFGESNEVFTPLTGGTSADDIRTGRVSSLAKGGVPHRSTLMKLSQISTLWDYINRAMPWNAPKSLSSDEVYAVVAYILNLGDIVPADFTLSERNMAEVQARLPNRNGMVRFDGLWSVHGKPDVQGQACMRNCKAAVEISSSLPDFARDAHGNLAEQNRLVGPVRGADTTRPALTEPLAPGAASAPRAVVATAAARREPADLAREAGCLACHAVSNRLIGPAFRDVAARYAGQADAPDRLATHVREGSAGVWGAVAMPPQAGVADDDLRVIMGWILGRAPRGF
ncbi:MAG: c-type cytochrome [Burkholderiaceae bacterium]|nr:c-type cytochrome [Burkholderiaceae bacterium]